MNLDRIINESDGVNEYTRKAIRLFADSLTPTNTDTLSDIVSAFVKADAALKFADKAREIAKSVLVAEYNARAIATAVGNGKRVTVTTAERRNFDSATLAELVTGEIFAQVTKSVVDIKLFDIARNNGDISEITELAVVKPTAYTSVLVSEA